MDSKWTAILDSSPATYLASLTGSILQARRLRFLNYIREATVRFGGCTSKTEVGASTDPDWRFGTV
ncbi:MAG: hypothetical protein OXI63_19340 [Candidatus Poribacteria bacterium]|nr:hypothetical protein [Candidatus Poribacteria bacterium]